MEELREVVESGPVVVSVGGLRLVEVVWRSRRLQLLWGGAPPGVRLRAVAEGGVGAPPRPSRLLDDVRMRLARAGQLVGSL